MSVRSDGATPSSAYSAASAGVHAVACNLAIELAPHKIRVTAVAPAVVETPVYSTFLSDVDVAEVLPTLASFAGFISGSRLAFSNGAVAIGGSA